MSLDDLKCASCAATEVQRLSMVYQSGTSIINTTTRGSATGIGIGSGGKLGFGTAATRNRTTGTQVSELAQRAAPPAKKMAVRWVVIGLVAAFVLAAINNAVLGMLALAGCGFLAYQGFRHNTAIYPGLRERWEQSWLCHRCGAIFAR